LPPPDIEDAVVDAYKSGVDRSLLRENLRLTHEERAQKFAEFLASVNAIRGAALAEHRDDF
jgi:hypothetical protein